MAKKFLVSGMSCASCQAHVEKAVRKVPGVTSCSVNLLTNSMVVEGMVADENIIKAVKKAGYDASVSDGKYVKEKDKPTLKILTRFIVSCVFLLVLMYFSMGYTMAHFPIGSFFESHLSYLGLFEMVLSLIIIGINFRFFINGTKGVIKLSPNMDTLVALGSAASFIYSVVILVLLFLAESNGSTNLATAYFHGLYFETAAMIPTLITLGKMLESKSKGRTTNALKDLMNLAPKTALIKKDNNEIEIPIDELKLGDIYILKAGSSVPADGVIIYGSGSLDESMITGESIPLDKTINQLVSSGTILKSGYLECEVKKVSEDSTLSQIIRMVNEANSSKAPISRLADRVSAIFVPLIILIGVIVTVAWLVYGGIKGSPDSNIPYAGFALARGISVLVIACPCALGLATPVAIMVASGLGAKNGILFKSAEAIEETGECDFIVLDKTGTITKGIPSVVSYLPFIEGDLLSFASSLESKSEHPLARAIINYAKENNAKTYEVNDYQTLVGHGVLGKINGDNYAIGKPSFIGLRVEVPSKALEETNKLTEEGKTCIYLEKNGLLAAIFAISDVIRDDALQAINELVNLGLTPIMLTGDNKKTAKAIAEEIGIKEVIAEVLPQEKEAIIRSLQKKGKVIMVGDGVNDAPALSRANVGISISSGTDIAIESAEVVITHHSLTSLAGAIRISRRTLWNIKENLFWAFFYNAACIPIAAGVFYFLWGWALNPMLGAAAMACSSLTVVLNALRINLIEVYNGENDHPLKKLKGVKYMEKILLVEGMMCNKCEAHVEEALLKIKGVSSVKADHLNGQVSLILTKEIKLRVFEKALKPLSYKVLGEK